MTYVWRISDVSYLVNIDKINIIFNLSYYLLYRILKYIIWLKKNTFILNVECFKENEWMRWIEAWKFSCIGKRNMPDWDFIVKVLVHVIDLSGSVIQCFPLIIIDTDGWNLACAEGAFLAMIYMYIKLCNN